MKIQAKVWLATAMAVTLFAYVGERAQAELIHEWGFEETIGTGPVDTDGGPDTFSQNLNLVGLPGPPAGPTAVQVSNVGTSAPVGLGGQALKAGDGNAATVGGQKASVWSTTGVPGIGYKGLNAGTASVWVYRTADQQVGNNSSTIFTVERDGSTGGGGRISVQVVMPTAAAGVPAGRVVGGITVSGREGAGNSARMTYATQAAQGNLVPLNTWTHVAAVWDYLVGDPDADTFDQGTMKLYVNGLPVLGGTYAGFWPDANPVPGPAGVNGALVVNDSNGLVLGSGNADPGIATANQEEFEGLIDAMQLYNTGLNDAEVLSLYRSYLVPEPTSLVLLTLGTLALIGRRRVV